MMREINGFTVKQLARLAGITPRALHYYDEIGLLPPAEVGENGYRYYNDASLLRLQQILFYRELDVPLEEIQRILDRPDFDVITALTHHRKALLARAHRIGDLVQSIDKTIAYLKGERKMQKKEFFEAFNEEQEKHYSAEAEQLWGDEVKKSYQRWNSYTPERKKAIHAESQRIFSGLAENMPRGAASQQVQDLVDQLFHHMGVFFNCTIEIFENMGHMYNSDPRFQATFTAMDPDLPAFLEEAITIYCQGKK
jgi:MerR family transcriptional regulator, thiopeptide resistance regulator